MNRDGWAGPARRDHPGCWPELKDGIIGRESYGEDPRPDQGAYDAGPIGRPSFSPGLESFFYSSFVQSEPIWAAGGSPDGYGLGRRAAGPGGGP